MAKTAKTQTNRTIASRADRAPKVLVDDAARLTEHDIAHRAYDLYLARGRQDGHDVHDWLQAEREVRSTARSTSM